MKKLKFRFLTAVLAAAVIVLSGCAGAQIADKKILSFTITPYEHLMPGSVVTVRVETTPDITAVNGWIEIAGLPKVSLKYIPKEKAWMYKNMIPITQPVPKGEFTVKVEAVSASGGTYTEEKKVSTY